MNYKNYLSKNEIFSLLREVVFLRLCENQWKKKELKFLMSYLNQIFHNNKIGNMYDMKYVLNKILDLEIGTSVPISQCLAQSIYNEIQNFRNDTKDSMECMNSQFFSLLPRKSNFPDHEIVDAENIFKLVNTKILSEISHKKIVVSLLLFVDSVKRAICNNQIYLVSKYFLWIMEVLNDHALQWINSNGGWMKIFGRLNNNSIVKIPTIYSILVFPLNKLVKSKCFYNPKFILHRLFCGLFLSLIMY